MNLCEKWRWSQALFPLFAWARSGVSKSPRSQASVRCARREPRAWLGGRPRRQFEIHASAPSPLALNWKEYNVDGVVMVKLRGEIDLHHSPKLRRLLQMKACARTPALLLDFTEVSRIDSSGLATLMEYYQHAQRHGLRFAVAGLSGLVRSRFDLVRFSDIFNLYSSVDEALKRIQESPLAQNPL